MPEEKDLEFLVEKTDDDCFTTYHFERKNDGDYTLKGEISVSHNSKNGIFYKLNKCHDYNPDDTVFVSLKDEKWFLKNLLVVKEIKERTDELTSVFKGESL